MVYVFPEARWSPFCLLSPHPRKCLFLSKLNPRNTEPKSILVRLVPRETLLLADACGSNHCVHCLQSDTVAQLPCLPLFPSAASAHFLFLQSTAQ